MFRTNLGTACLEMRTFQVESQFHKRVEIKKVPQRKRLRNNDPSSDSYSGPWALFEDERRAAANSVSETAGIAKSIKPLYPEACPCESTSTEPSPASTCILHGKTRNDWKGNNWLRNSGATSVPVGDVTCILPRRNAFAWKGHASGVQALCLFPNQAHMMLSASMDSTIKIWDLFDDRECRVTYQGHSLGVRDVKFAFSGTKFYSSAFDTNVHQWDTETGKIITSFSNNSINYSIAVHPDDNNSIVLANQYHKVIQFDAASGKVVLEYSEHLGPVSAVAFCENGRKFITSSDDRKIFVWNYGIPVVDKHVSDHLSHAIPALSFHPSGNFLAGQAMNNSISVYQAFGEYRNQSNKKFYGHSSAGYAIQPGFSPDGKYIMSGSSDGQLYFWDWKSSKMYRNFKAHDGVCMGSLWHPSAPSKVLSWGWDGDIKLWE